MRTGSKVLALLGAVLCIGLVGVDTADAQRRGGGFGSRGARTYQAPPPTRTAPQQAAPVQRSMTQPPPGQAAPGQPATAGQGAQRQGAAAAAPGAQAQQPRRGGFLGGLGGGLLGGLLAGGLIGALMGNGFGAGMAGMASMLFQIALVGGVIALVMMFLRRRQQAPQAAAAGAAQNWSNVTAFRAPEQQAFNNGGGFGGGQTAVPVTAMAAPSAVVTEEIGLTMQDRETFERLLMDIQHAIAGEDYAALRERTTPEVMGYLAEDLASNATSGRRIEIRDTRLLEADIAEAWREGDRDYATAAMRFEAIDLVRDRATGAILEGDPDRPRQTTEVWTFVRQAGGAWKLSAIQEV
ncbi:MAG: TIM44-like domain-containing protein [Caulobacterales bacterium]|nr:TIM44-like domain-containing protein [Caulobacterales bacterium]